MAEKTAEKGKTVEVEYKGTFEDGKVFDSTEGKQPLKFIVGKGEVIKGFDNAVEGMKEGEEKEIKLESKDAYGDPNPQLVKKFPRDKFPQDKELKPGMVAMMQTPQGQIPATIKEVNDQEVTLDLNHPLAGKRLNFKVKIVNVS